MEVDTTAHGQSVVREFSKYTRGRPFCVLGRLPVGMGAQRHSTVSQIRL